MSKKGTMVVATAMGFYGCLRERGSPAFEISGEEAFAPNWMERVDAATARQPQEGAGQPELEFTVKHVPAGNWVVVDKEGNRASRVFKKDEGEAKGLAQQEAIRLNQGGDKVLDGPTGGGAVQPLPEDNGSDPTLPDA